MTDTRICIKGLPPDLDEPALRERFSERGEVTDAKVIRTGDGRSRQFGFVGYTSAAEAQDAIKYFNRSFIGTFRLVVEPAYQHGTSVAPRPWSKYSEGTSAHERAQPKEEAPAKKSVREEKKKRKLRHGGEPAEEDPKLREFLEVMQPRVKGALWSNDAGAVKQAAGAAPGQHGAASSKRKRQQAVAEDAAAADEDGDEEDDALYQELPSKAAIGADGGSEEESEESDDDEEREDRGGEDVTDMDYLKSRKKAVLADDEDAGSEDGGSDGDEESGDDDAEEDRRTQAPRAAGGSSERSSDTSDAPAEEAAEDDAAAAEERRASGAAAGPAPHVTEASDAGEAIAETGRLFLRNLAYSATEADLTALLSPYGELREVHLVLDRTTRKSKGIALAQFESPADAVAAHAALDRSVFLGRLLHILPGQRPPPPPEAAGGGREGFKAARKAARRGDAGNRATWNSLFMRQDTVAEAVAAHYGVTKAELLNPSASDLAVRMALGETQVMAATKRDLAAAGVDVARLEASAGAGADKAAVPRSADTLLVKNLPYATTAAELEALFGAVGELGRVVLPPTRTLALVEFLEAADARAAFRGLAYKRFQHVPLYLEWAPADIFTAKVTPQEAVGATVGSEHAEDGAASTANAEAEDDDADGSTLFVKNLAWKTDDARLKAHFSKAVAAAGGILRAASVSRKKDAGPDGKPLSKGFGFVECSSDAVARAVMTRLQGSMLDGHKLAIQLSQRKTAAPPAAADSRAALVAPGKAATTKLVVRNVAFEGTRRDVLGLFSPFGAVRSCRLPRKFDGTHRGFAFVDFATRQEAQAALEAVLGTHLYGRRLVVEWAENEEGLDELRDKTASKFEQDAAPAKQGSKRRKAEKPAKG